MKKSSLLDTYSKVNKSDEDRRENDFYPSPPLSVYSLIKKYPDIPKRILEPCSGCGDISYELARNGFLVTSTDLHKYDNTYVNVQSGVDYMTQPKLQGVDGVITNPPYHKDLAFRMLEKSVKDYDFTAFLLRITFLEGKRRHDFFKENPPTKVLVFSDRLGFSKDRSLDFFMNRQNKGMICYAFFIWDSNSKVKNEVDWVLASDYYQEWKDSLDEKWYRDILGDIPNNITNYV